MKQRRKRKKSEKKIRMIEFLIGLKGKYKQESKRKKDFHKNRHEVNRKSNSKKLKSALE